MNLLFVFYQDLRYRAVYWLAFPPLLVLLLLLAYRDNSPALMMINSGSNLAFLLVQFAALSLYFSLKRKRWVNITRGLLGWGDILFILCLAFYFSLLNFLLFYISSLIVVLLLTGLSFLMNKKAGKKIPLAGMQALLFALLMITGWVTGAFNLTSDNWLLTFMSR